MKKKKKKLLAVFVVEIDLQIFFGFEIFTTSAFGFFFMFIENLIIYLIFL